MHIKGLIGVLILSAATLSGCHSGSSSSSGACTSSFTYCELTSVAYGAGEFVAVGWAGNSTQEHTGNPRIEVSTDGINWTPENIQYTQAQLNQANQLQSITYGQDGFVATDGVHVAHSADGLNWTIESFQDTSDRISYVLYDGTRYILYSSTTGQIGDALGIIYNFPWKVSTDGLNWTDYGKITVTNGPAGEPVWIIHEQGMYEAAWQPAKSVTSARYLTATSTDGLSWTLSTLATGLGSSTINTAVYDILRTGDQYLLLGSTPLPGAAGYAGVALHGSSLSALTLAGPLAFSPVGSPFYLGAPDPTHGLVSNGTVTVALGTPGLFMTTDGVTWNDESMDGVVPFTECSGYHQPNSCTGFASGAAAPGGSIVVLVSDGAAGAETTDGVHWVTSNL